MNNRNRDLLAGETMFDYLRKKKMAVLQKTLNRSKGVNASDFGSSRLDQTDASVDYQKTRRNQSKETCCKSTINQLNSKVDSKSVTPKRVALMDEDRRPATRSFLQMISPIRSKSPLPKEAEASVKNSPRFSKKEFSKENYTKRMVRQKVANLRDLIQNLVRSGRNLKEKFHFLFVELQPFFRHIQHCDQARIEKKTEVIKGQLKAVEHNFRDFNIETTQESINSFFLHISELFNELEGSTLAEIQSNKNTVVSEITLSKNVEIAGLQQDKKKLEKEVLSLMKQHEKLQQKYEHLEQSAQNKIENTEIERHESIERYRSQCEREKQLSQVLKLQNEDLEGLVAQQQSELKKMIYEHDKYRGQCFNTINKVKSEQEEFLLNEIMVMKKEFGHDMTEMSKLHKIKEEEFMFKTRDMNADMERMKGKMNDVVRGSIGLEEAARDNEAQAARFRKQNQMLAIDLHRINEELYQHWLALKDIKTLSIRLDSFNSFKKIYEELLFNEQLFL